MMKRKSLASDIDDLLSVAPREYDPEEEEHASATAATFDAAEAPALDDAPDGRCEPQYPVPPHAHTLSPAAAQVTAEGDAARKLRPGRSLERLRWPCFLAECASGTRR